MAFTYFIGIVQAPVVVLVLVFDGGDGRALVALPFTRLTCSFLIVPYLNACAIGGFCQLRM